MEKCLETYKLVINEMGSEENKSYIKNISLKKLVSASEKYYSLHGWTSLQNGSYSGRANGSNY